MGIDLSALATNADKLDECIDKNKKREQDRKDEQLYGTIERKVKKEEHKRTKRSRWNPQEVQKVIQGRC